VRTCVGLMVLMLLTSGCQKVEFTHRAEFNNLEEFAQDYVGQILTNYFGTATDMVVWDRLKLNSNLANGEVTFASNGSGQTRIVLNLTEPHQEIPPGTELFWVNGDLSGKESSWISEWNNLTNTATLETKLEALPVAGTKVILGPGQVLAQGRHLYAVHCQHCHGVTGDGAGPTAEYLNPLPRDYRRGIYKFTLTQASERASRVDLTHIIEDGIPGTYMPSFKLLSPDEMQSVVEYVLWLSMRGEMEYQLVRYLSTDYSKEAVKERIEAGLEAQKEGEEDFETYDKIRKEFIALANDPEELQYEFLDSVDLMVSRWESAQSPDAQVVPTEKWANNDPASIERGRQLYLSVDLNCFACHGEAGFGDGPQTYAITKDLDTGKDNPKPGLYDAWGHPSPPRNLHTGIYRGGRRPIDLYARIHAGIKGTSMPAFGSKLKDQEIWDIVNFIYSVPFQSPKAGDGLKQATGTATTEGSVSMKETPAN